MTISPNVVLPGDEVTITVSYDFAQTTAPVVQMFIYLPRACTYCLVSNQCLCGPDELNSLYYDGGTDRYNVDQDRFISGVGRNDDEGILGLGTPCAWALTPIFSLPDQDVPEVITHSFTSVFNRANWPCREFGCYCPQLIDDPNQSNDEQIWYGNFVMAREIGAGNRIAVQILDVGVDLAFEPDVTDPCEE